MNPTTKTILLGASLFAVMVSANVVGQAVYSRTNIDIDWKRIALGSALGIGAGFLLIKAFKK
jgi:hypothetical protein